MTDLLPPSAERLDIRPARSRPDQTFRLILGACASSVLVIIVAIVLFLIVRIGPGWRAYGLRLFTANFNAHGPYGFGADLIGSVIIAAVALLIGFPLSMATALAINEYVPRSWRRSLTALVDLLAAVPSLVYGLWGLYVLNDHLFLTQNWLAHHANFFPLFRLSSNTPIGRSEFLAGIVVAIMILPLMTAISREVMSQVPRADCEAALALGGTRWGMVTDVILPFARSGIIGGAMLGLGRALGETIAVSIIVNANDQFSSHILQSGGGSVSALIARQFSSSGSVAQSALILGGLVLFAVTLSVNLLARVVVSRGVVRS